MAGRKNTKWMETMIKRYGSREAVSEVMRESGRLGGTKSVNGGFASDVVGKDGLTGRERAKAVGRAGGSKSKRGKAKKNK